MYVILLIDAVFRTGNSGTLTLKMDLEQSVAPSRPSRDCDVTGMVGVDIQQ